MINYYIHIIILCVTFKEKICEIIHRTVLIIKPPISCFVKFYMKNHPIVSLKMCHCIKKDTSHGKYPLEVTTSG